MKDFAFRPVYYFRLKFGSRTGRFQMEGAGGTSGLNTGLNTGWREFGLFQIDRHARRTFFFVGSLARQKEFSRR